MPSKTEISNIALSHLGVGKEIANLDNEKSQEAAACRRFFDEARNATLRAFAWPFATKFEALALVADPPTETSEWGLSYRYPSDCACLRRIQSGIRNETPQTRIPYKLGRDSQGELIYTDEPDAKVEYTLREEDPLRYPPDFVLAFSFLLASYIAPRVTGGDPFKLGTRAAQFYLQHITMAQANSANEAVIDRPPESEMIRAREGDVLVPGRLGIDLP
jgi:hypothetical protein